MTNENDIRNLSHLPIFGKFDELFILYQRSLPKRIYYSKILKCKESERHRRNNSISQNNQLKDHEHINMDQS